MGGPYSSTWNSVVAAAELGIETTLIFPVADLEKGHALLDAGTAHAPTLDIRLFPLSRIFNKGFASSVGYSAALTDFVRANQDRFDLLHFHGAWTYPSLISIRKAVRNGTPVTLTPHESLTRYDLSHARSLPFYLAKRLAKRFRLRGLDSVICSSPIEKRDSLDPALSQRWPVIAHPVVDLRAATHPQPISDSSQREPLEIGYLGRIHPKKNIPLLIEAVARSGTQCRLQIAGDGETGYVDSIKNWALQAGFHHRVSWLGHIGREHRRALFSRIDLLALPSTYECFGMAAAEAMSAGTPVLVSNEVGIADVVMRYEAGAVIAPSVDGIRDVLQRLSRNPEMLETWSRNSLAAAQSNFSLEAHGTALSAHYRELVSTTSGRRP